MRTASKAGAFPIAIMLTCSPALAQSDDDTRVDREREEITVTGVRQPYRGNFALREIPQAIATIDAKVLEQNTLLRLTDALDLNASVVRQNTLGGLWDSFAVRGFAGDENLPSGYLVNGFNAGRGFSGQRDVAGIERIEVLKGPAAAVLGRGEPGGSINLVTKQAELGRTFGTASLQYGSFDTVRAEGDANVSLTDTLSARLIGYAESGDSFRDTVQQKRWGFLPSIGLKLGDATRLTYDFEWTRVEVPFDRGIVVLNNNFDTVPRSRFLGEPSDGDTVARATGHQLRLQHDFDDRWSLSVGASHRDTLLTSLSSDAETLRSRQKLYVDGRSLSRQRRSRRYTSEHSVLRAELAGEFRTGTLRHRILLGGDFDYFDTDQLFTRYRGPVVTATTTDQAGYVLDLQNPVYGRYPPPVTAPITNRLDIQRTMGAYLQDQISLTDRLQVRVGGRYDDFLLRVDNRLTSVLGRRSRSRLSPQAGIVYAVSTPVSLYAAYGEGYRANIGADASGNVFEPETSRSIEAGVKLTALGGKLTGTLAAYQLTKTNVLATDPLNPGFSVAIGKARSRGIEADLNGRLPGGVDVLLSYAYTHAEARSRVLDTNFSFQIEPGDPLINIPKHNVNMQAVKRFSLQGRGALLGAGLQYVGKRNGETATDFTLPSHTLFRVFGQLDIIDGVQLFGSVTNLFDEHWYANSYSPVWVQPGAPRTATIGVRTSF
ncbi:iron complex outermembrane receptor protein [Sphingomonas sp. PP-CE-3G-477]|uniref:TonB-dependent siderophore receptor n=1 Tax=Sphingomonas sp. PP-CE-3G-477 TaxID=2135660 RepID=UPI000D35168C|nr:TonB-dependent siderophore receptor [Sphingomonas sp. PP-CE-3G-477]PTQ66175.1 iron complex outermembrane receptor protein [Sphingomonas sp. PP-CE-3G-477]